MRWTVTPTPVTQADATALIRQYFVEIVARYHDRPATDEQVDQALAESPSDDLVAPSGQFLVARHDGVAAGCVGLRLLSPEIGEVTRMFVVADKRGLGVASLLLDAVEEHARRRGVSTMRLNTRSDLVEARSLYARHGYGEIEPYTDDPYADHFFEKHLG